MSYCGKIHLFIGFYKQICIAAKLARFILIQKVNKGVFLETSI